MSFGVVSEVFRLESDATMQFGWIEHKLIHYSRQLGMRAAWYFIREPEPKGNGGNLISKKPEDFLTGDLKMSPIYDLKQGKPITKSYRGSVRRRSIQDSRNKIFALCMETAQWEKKRNAKD